jgi:hypothetical protein
MTRIELWQDGGEWVVSLCEELSVGGESREVRVLWHGEATPREAAARAERMAAEMRRPWGVTDRWGRYHEMDTLGAAMATAYIEDTARRDGAFAA